MTTRATETWAVLPMKSFARGKSRLGVALGDDERSALAQRMFEHVLGVTTSAPELSGTLVATDGEDVARLAKAAGAQVLSDAHGASLAQVVDAALDSLEARGADGALVLMADLPELTPADVRAVLAARAHADVVIVTDQSGDYTNALALPLSRGYRSCFGAKGSAARHRAQAAELGLSALVLDNPRIAFDVDTPDAIDAIAAAPNARAASPKRA